jgi:uncharacterized lipoprotein NlpE involved in copper resistance
MLKKAVVILMLIYLALLIWMYFALGCDGRGKYVGGYRRYGKPDDILQLRKDGTFLKRETDIVDSDVQTSETGTWVVRGNEIILTTKDNQKLVYFIPEGSEGLLVDKIGVEWRKD